MAATGRLTAWCWLGRWWRVLHGYCPGDTMNGAVQCSCPHHVIEEDE